MPPPFCIKANLRENRFLHAGIRLVDKKGSHSVKIRTQKKTK